MKLSRSHSVSLLGAAVAVLAAFPVFTGAAWADPVSTQCADFLGQRLEEQVVTVREILSYDSLGFSLADHAGTDKSAVNLAVSRCDANIGVTVYQAIKGAR